MGQADEPLGVGQADRTRNSGYLPKPHPRQGDFLATLRVIDLNLPAVQHFGRSKATLERQGDRVADADLYIASIALAEGATLITGNLRHYERIPNLLIEDWIRGAE